MKNNIVLNVLIFAFIPLTSSASSVASQADLNQDGIVDVNDFTLLRHSMSTDALQHDIDGDGVVTGTDYSVLRFYFNQLVLVNGIWKGACNDVNAEEFQQENISIHNGLYTQEYVNSANSDCSSPWLTIRKVYSYTTSNMGLVESEGALLDLRLQAVVSIPYEQAVVDSLNTICNKNDFILNSENNVSGVQCQGAVQYPVNGVTHFERIKRDHSNIVLGDRLDVINASDRSTQLSTKRVFSFAGSF